MKTKLLAGLLMGALAGVSVQAALVNFSYTQTDLTTGSGTIAPFSFMGHDFTATSLPLATVVNPGGTSLAGYVGSITGMAGAGNEANQAVGLLFSGSVTATATDGATIQIPLRFVAKQTQTPDVSDYTWSIAYGDNPGLGVDATSVGSLRIAVYFSRDDVLDAIETPDTFQRYTQPNVTFVAGQDSFVNTDTTSAAIKDATDPPGAPAGVDAAGRDLAVYFAWRDQGTLSGSILVDTFTIGGLLEADENTLVVPEPSSVALCILGGTVLLLMRRRRH